MAGMKVWLFQALEPESGLVPSRSSTSVTTCSCVLYSDVVVAWRRGEYFSCRLKGKTSACD
eukprot:52572-Amphidinium_carterae.1